MGKVTWGGDFDGSTFDDAERSQFKPYDGPIPANAMYAWKVKNVKRGETSNGNDQLIIGLELIPRRSRPDEKKYKGYYITHFLVMTEGTAWKVAPFLDALGVSGADLVSRTKDTGEEDNRGNVPLVSIGKWKNDGSTIVLASLEDDDYKEGRKRIREFWPVEDAAKDEDDEEESDDSEDDEEEAPKRPAKKAAAKKSTKRAEPDEDADEDDDEEERRPAKKAAAKKAAPAKKAAGKRKAKDEDADEDDEDGDEAPF